MVRYINYIKHLWQFAIEIKKGKLIELSPISVPRPGIEPGWIAPLVFETSASTNSAIWASLSTNAVQKYEINTIPSKHLLGNLC